MRDLRDPQRLGEVLIQVAGLERAVGDGSLPYEVPLSEVYDDHAAMLDCVPAAVDPDPVARYPRRKRNVVTSYVDEVLS
jgi:hypothetical protein